MFNITDLTASLAGVAGIGNIISTINNLKQDKYQIQSFIYSLKAYKSEVENYFNEAKKDFDLLKNPEQIKSDILAEFSKVENEFHEVVSKLHFKK